MKAIILFIALSVLLTACTETVQPDVQPVNETNETGPPGPLEITMEAKMFDFEPATIRAKVNQTVILHVTSTDVVHGIAINAFGVREFLPVGEEVTVTFVPDKAGEFDFYCSEFCGEGHRAMRGKLIVTE